MSVYKARFTFSEADLDKLVDNYQALNGPITFLTSAGICKDTSEIVGKQQEIMFFIGFVVGMGNSSLEHVSKV